MNNQVWRIEEAELVRLRDRSERLSRRLRKAQANIRWFRRHCLTTQAVDSFARTISRSRVLLGLARRSALGRDAETRQILAAAFSAKGEGLALPPRVLAWLSRPRTLLGLLRRRVLAGGAAAEGVLSSALRARLGVGAAIPKEPSFPDSERELAQAQRRLAKATARLMAERGRAEEVERKLTAVEHAMVAEERALFDAQIELTKLRRGARVDGEAPAPEAPLELAR